MPAKKAKSVKNVKNIDQLYSNFVQETNKERKRLVATKPKLEKKKKQQVEIKNVIVEEESLEKERYILLNKIDKILKLEIPESDKVIRVKELFDPYLLETQDKQFIIIIQTLLDNYNDIGLLPYMIDEVNKNTKLREKNPKKAKKLYGGNILYFFKNTFMAQATEEGKELYADYVRQEIDNTSRELVEEKKKSNKKERDQILTTLYQSLLQNNYKQFLTQLTDRSLKDILEKIDSIGQLETVLSQYLEFSIKEKDLNPLEFLVREYNKLGGEVEKSLDQELDYYSDLLDRIQKNVQEDIQQDQEDEEMPEEIYVKKAGVPLKDVKIIITPEMEEKLKKLYMFVSKDIKSSDKDSAVILGVNSGCLNLQLYKPWIYKFSHTLVSASEEILQKYTIPENLFPPVVLNGVKYYHPNKLFHILQCGYFSTKMRRQNQDILSLYEDANTRVDFKVAHVLKDGSIILQDQVLFDKEVEYIKNRDLLTDSEKLLNSQLGDNYKVQEITKRISKNKIKSGIMKVAEKNQLVVDENQVEKYADDIVENIFKQNAKKQVRVFLLEVANILIYMDNRMLGEYATNFQQKLVNMFYRTDKIRELTNTNRFEELYKNNRYPPDLKNKISQRIEFYKGIIAEEISKETVYELVGRPTRKRDFEKLVDKLDLPIMDLKQICKNKDMLDSSLSEYLIYEEKSTGDIYCISLYNIGTVNPYTDKPYPPSVLKELEKLDRNMINRYFNQMLFGEEDQGDKDNLAPNLIDVLIKNIKDMEDQLTLSDKPVAEICDYCKKHVNPTKPLKTVVKYGPKSKIVQFCKLKCFENWETRK